MRESELSRIKEAAWSIFEDRTARKLEKLEALKIVAGCKGVFLPDIREDFLTDRQLVELRRAKAEILDKVLGQRARRKKNNRLAYLRKRLREAGKLQETETNG